MQEFRFPLSPEQSFRHIFFRFENSPYDCLLQIRDTSGFREFYVPIVTAEGEAPHIFETDVCGDSFELNLIPVAADLSEHINEFRANLEKDRTGGKLLSFFVSKAASLLDTAVSSLLLLVGCQFRISDVFPDAMFDVRLSGCRVGSKLAEEIFDMFPVLYSFYEINCGSQFFSPENTWSLNREELVRSVKRTTLMDFGLHCIITYPIQGFRAKRLTANKRVRKVIQKFYTLSPEEREKQMEKW